MSASNLDQGRMGWRPGVAVFTAACFLLSTVLAPWAEAALWESRRSAQTSLAPKTQAFPEPRAAAPALVGLEIPETLGSVVEAWDGALPSSGRSPLAILIEDAHGVYAAQRNSAEILRGLSQAEARPGHREPLLVCVEGAWGPVRPEWVQAFPDAGLRRQSIEALLRESEITGEEYLAMIQPPGSLRIVGVEDPVLYRANLRAREALAGARPALLIRLAALDRRLAALRAKVYPKRLADLESASARFHEQRMTVGDYLALLSARAVPDPKLYPALSALRGLLALERSFSPSELERERSGLLKALGEKLDQAALVQLARWSLRYRLGQTDALSYHSLLLELAKAQGRQTPRLAAYVDYLRRARGVDGAAVSSELRKLERSAFAALSKGSPEAERVAVLSLSLRRQRQFWTERFSPDDWEEYLSETDGPRTLAELESAVARESARLRIPADRPGPPVRTDATDGQLRFLQEAYYRLAFKRNSALVERALNAARERGSDRLVLIAGGFHTAGMSALLRKRGIRYVVIRPRLAADGGPSEADAVSFRSIPRAAFGTLRAESQVPHAGFRNRVNALMLSALQARDGDEARVRAQGRFIAGLDRLAGPDPSLSDEIPLWRAELRGLAAAPRVRSGGKTYLFGSVAEDGRREGFALIFDGKGRPERFVPSRELESFLAGRSFEVGDRYRFSDLEDARAPVWPPDLPLSAEREGATLAFRPTGTASLSARLQPGSLGLWARAGVRLRDAGLIEGMLTAAAAILALWGVVPELPTESLHLTIRVVAGLTSVGTLIYAGLALLHLLFGVAQPDGTVLHWKTHGLKAGIRAALGAAWTASSSFVPPALIFLCAAGGALPWPALALSVVPAALIHAWLNARFESKGLPAPPRYRLKGRSVLEQIHHLLQDGAVPYAVHHWQYSRENRRYLAGAVARLIDRDLEAGISSLSGPRVGGFIAYCEGCLQFLREVRRRMPDQHDPVDMSINDLTRRLESIVGAPAARSVLIQVSPELEDHLRSSEPGDVIVTPSGTRRIVLSHSGGDWTFLTFRREQEPVVEILSPYRFERKILVRGVRWRRATDRTRRKARQTIALLEHCEDSNINFPIRLAVLQRAAEGEDTSWLFATRVVPENRYRPEDEHFTLQYFSGRPGDCIRTPDGTEHIVVAFNPESWVLLTRRDGGEFAIDIIPSRDVGRKRRLFLASRLRGGSEETMGLAQEALGLLQRAARFGIDAQSRTLTELRILIAGRRPDSAAGLESEALPRIYSASPGDVIVGPDGTRRVIVVMSEGLCYFMKSRGDGEPGIETMMTPQVEDQLFLGGEIFLPGDERSIRLAHDASELFEAFSRSGIDVDVPLGTTLDELRRIIARDRRPAPTAVPSRLRLGDILAADGDLKRIVLGSVGDRIYFLVERVAQGPIIESERVSRVVRGLQRGELRRIPRDSGTLDQVRGYPELLREYLGYGLEPPRSVTAVGLLDAVAGPRAEADLKRLSEGDRILSAKDGTVRLVLGQNGKRVLCLVRRGKGADPVVASVPKAQLLREFQSGASRRREKTASTVAKASEVAAILLRALGGGRIPGGIALPDIRRRAALNDLRAARPGDRFRAASGEERILLSASDRTAWFLLPAGGGSLEAWKTPEALNEMAAALWIRVPGDDLSRERARQALELLRQASDFGLDRFRPGMSLRELAAAVAHRGALKTLAESRRGDRLVGRSGTEHILIGHAGDQELFLTARESEPSFLQWIGRDEVARAVAAGRARFRDGTDASREAAREAADLIRETRKRGLAVRQGAPLENLRVQVRRLLAREMLDGVRPGDLLQSRSGTQRVFLAAAGDKILLLRRRAGEEPVFETVSRRRLEKLLSEGPLAFSSGDAEAVRTAESTLEQLQALARLGEDSIRSGTPQSAVARLLARRNAQAAVRDAVPGDALREPGGESTDIVLARSENSLLLLTLAADGRRIIRRAGRDEAERLLSEGERVFAPATGETSDEARRALSLLSRARRRTPLRFRRPFDLADLAGWLERRTRRERGASDEAAEDRSVESDGAEDSGDYPAGGVVPILCDLVLAAGGWVSDRTGLPRLTRRAYGRWFAFGLENGLLFLGLYFATGFDLQAALDAGSWLRGMIWGAFFLAHLIPGLHGRAPPASLFAAGIVALAGISLGLSPLDAEALLLHLGVNLFSSILFPGSTEARAESPQSVDGPGRIRQAIAETSSALGLPESAVAPLMQESPASAGAEDRPTASGVAGAVAAAAASGRARTVQLNLIHLSERSPLSDGMVRAITDSVRRSGSGRPQRFALVLDAASVRPDRAQALIDELERKLDAPGLISAVYPNPAAAVERIRRDRGLKGAEVRIFTMASDAWEGLLSVLSDGSIDAGIVLLRRISQVDLDVTLDADEAMEGRLREELAKLGLDDSRVRFRRDRGQVTISGRALEPEDASMDFLSAVLYLQQQ